MRAASAKHGQTLRKLVLYQQNSRQILVAQCSQITRSELLLCARGCITILSFSPYHLYSNVGSIIR